MKLKQPERVVCLKCDKAKALNNYYVNTNPLFSSDKLAVCKNCIVDYIGLKDSPGYLDRIKLVLALMNKPFIEETFERSERDWGKYIPQLSSLPNYKGKTFSDSEQYVNQVPECIVSTPPNFTTNEETLKELIDKWGDYPTEEVVLFEKKYKQLKVNYPERTAMHTEALQIYVRYRVKEELATTKGLYKEAEAWGKLAKEAATAAKINPSQLSKADLSDGLDSFSQLTRNVEQAIDVIEILPYFKERPQDSVDFTIWCYVNYVRDLKGLPVADYKEIYSFYEQRKKEYDRLTEGEDDDIL
ncbi:hypothetical protein GRF59_15160 [Paenibacillus sp. HJL G12]|uniref:Uncharacterized protein n=1 Tax=Paenibacillus dendrobii TaxID=2691084 RepID=A0A7X3LI71_9BACL|nr:hypothetical protein [Paenibacillus dendrobii]MWV44960.1 hypothetical protein [Paenibacillus dendrobii]